LAVPTMRVEVERLVQLRSLRLKNFRACRDTEVTFAPDLTVVVGENASGKSAIIDALRLCTYSATARQTAWFEPHRDASHGAPRDEPVEVGLRFGQLSEIEKAIYLAELVDSHDDLIYTASFATDPTVPRRSISSWAVGDVLAEDPEPALRRRISHVYLPPLRDAVRDLDGGDQAHLYEVLRIIVGTEATTTDFVDAANDALKVISEHPVAVKTQDTIQNFFSETTPPNREHVIELNERTLELRRLARLLRIQLAESQVPVGDIAATGLGYANLLYIAMVVLQLVKAAESDLTLLLVEEPEAHLHPQLQLVLLDFLKRQAQATGQSSGSAKPGELPAAGKVQVIVTTHSPVLASTVSVSNVVVVARVGEGGDWCARATALGSIGLQDPDRRKIDRYLNATRAALLFARDVVLVEGIAEMLLLPALANYLFDDPALDDDEASRLRRQFRSVTIVSVEGVDFDPYLRLLLAGDEVRVDRVVVVTDRDHTGAGDVRKATYETAYAKHVQDGRLHVVVGGTTLEAEMFRETSNESSLRNAFRLLHPKSEHHWNAVIAAADGLTSDERADLFAAAIRDKSKKKTKDEATSGSDEPHLDISKGDFAHVIAEAVRDDTQRTLVVPAYLEQAINAAAHKQATT
jgi:putative ATP-dependent endonuclease of OLD family